MGWEFCENVNFMLLGTFRNFNFNSLANTQQPGNRSIIYQILVFSFADGQKELFRTVKHKIAESMYKVQTRINQNFFGHRNTEVV